MKKYELMVIIRNNLSDNEAKEYFEKGLAGILSEISGKITFSDFWGTRGFAYKIEAEKWGYYGVIQFEAAPEKPVELKKLLNVEKPVLRFLLTSVNPKLPEPKLYAEMKKESEALAPEKDTKEPAKKITAEKKETTPKPKVNTKLEKVLNDVSANL